MRVFIGYFVLHVSYIVVFIILLSSSFLLSFKVHMNRHTQPEMRAPAS